MYISEAYQNLDFAYRAGMFCLENKSIVFTNEYLKRVALPHNDPIVIIAEIGKSIVARFFMDGRAAMNVLYVDCWDKMLLNANHLIENDVAAAGFNGTSFEPTYRI